MSFTTVAAATRELLEAFRTAQCADQTIRRIEVLAQISEAFHDKTAAEAREAVMAAAEEAPGDRMFGVAMSDLIESIALLNAMATTFGAAQDVRESLSALETIAVEAGPVDVRAIVKALDEQALAEAEIAEQLASRRLRGDVDEREIGADYAARLTAAEGDDEVLQAIFNEMKRERPRLGAVAWRAAAEIFVSSGVERTEHAAREAIAGKIRASALETKQASAADRAFAAGF